MALCAAMNVADSWPPSAPPSVRITVFMPVATPVCVLDTDWMIRLPSAANASPIPTPSSPAAIRNSIGWLLSTDSSANEAVVNAVPESSAARDPKRAETRPA